MTPAGYDADVAIAALRHEGVRQMLGRPSGTAESMRAGAGPGPPGGPGPLMVPLPLDVQTAEAAASYQASARPIPPAAPAAAVEAALARLASAQRPVIIVGGGVRGPGY